LEGYLLPETYRVEFDASPRDVVRQMLKQANAVWDTAADRKAAALGLTRNQVLTLASIVEGEAKVPAERRRIAGVYYNRYKRHMLLQADPTVIYALKRDGRWRGELLRSDYDYESPYNTYMHAGLPPGPIANPGLDALKAAVNPARTSYLYFVADPTTGGHTFSTTFEDHLVAIAMARRGRAEMPPPMGPESPVTPTPTTEPPPHAGGS
ncbi:MAG TPA: endolytic transglycosylase MltG, partial [Thermoanaerobaculia bacterium]|nr:endolytic transglycosylase MltG [Thermoanaerobaculia bacterium]